MITLPPSFVMTPYQGYFWDVKTKKLYSIKSGVLRPMKVYKPTIWSSKIVSGWFYQISVCGKRRYVSVSWLYGLKNTNEHHEIEVY